MSVLGKRDSMHAADSQFDDSKLTFYKQHLSELLEPKGRLKYFIDYEFPKKQNLLKRYWQRALNLFFRHALQGSIVYWNDLLEFMNVDGGHPLGLPRLVPEFVEDGDLVILENELEFSKLVRFLQYDESYRPNEGIWNKIKGLFGSAKQNIQPHSLVVNVAQFNTLYQKAVEKLASVFCEKRLIAEEEFLDRCQKLWGFNLIDQKAIIVVLLAKEVLYRRKEHNLVFYFLRDLAKEPEIEFEALTQEVILERKLDLFDNKIEELANNVNKLTDELLCLKKQNKKDEAMHLLKKRRILNTQLEQLNGKRLLLQDIVIKIGSTRGERDLADVLKRASRILEDHEKNYETLTDSLGNFQAFSNQQEEMNNLIQDMGNRSELEEMYEELEGKETTKRPIIQQRQPIPKNTQDEAKMFSEKKPSLAMSDSVNFRRQMDELLK